MLQVIMASGSSVDRDREAKLIEAAKYGIKKDIIELLEYGVNVNGAVDEDGVTSLMWASWGEHVECTRVLLEGGAQANQQDNIGWTSLMWASSEGHVECTRVLLEGGAQANQQNVNGDTALHIAIYWGHSDCVRTLLSHPGMDPNIKNKQGRTAMGVQPCAYGKVMLCGHSGAGKSTLAKVIFQPRTMLTQLKERLFGAGEVEPLTAGIIPHQVDHSSMIIYDLAGHQLFFSSHSAYLEAISLHSPAIFLLLQDLRKDSDDITKELHHWAAMINGVCHKCPKKSSVIVVGTHADLLKKQQVSLKLNQLKSKSSEVITHQNLVDVVTLNLKKPYSTKMERFMKLLNKTNKAVLSMCQPIPGHCPLLLNFLKVKLPPDAHAISLSDLHARITGDEDMQVMDPQLSTIISFLKTLSERGLIALILSDDPLNNSWVVLQKECILKKVNGTLFADSNLKEYRQLSSNTGIIPKAVLSKAFPEYDVEMIAQFMIQFEMCQLVDLSKIDTNMKAESSDLGPLLFFPALVREDRPNSVLVPENSFQWHMIVKSPHQFFTPRFHDVLLHRLTLQFPLPAVQATSSLSPQCEVWKNGIKWLSGSGVTTIVEMDGIPFQSLSLAMSFPDPMYHDQFHMVLNTIKAAFVEFCPYLDTVELVSIPSEASSKSSAELPQFCTTQVSIKETSVELLLLQQALRTKQFSIINASRSIYVELAKWLIMEPCLAQFVGVKGYSGICDKHPAVMEGDLSGVEAKGSAGEDQAVNEGDISSEDCRANSPPTPSEDQTSYPPTLSGMPTIKLLTSLPSLVGGVRKNLNIIQRTSTSYTKLGMYLLVDDNWDIVYALREKYHHDPVEIVTAVYKKWISGTGRQPATWQTLVGVLREIEMNILADDIEATLSN